MASFLFFSKYANGLPIAYKLQQQGHDVLAWIEYPPHQHRYDGMLKKVSSWEDAIEEDRICIFDHTGIGHGEEPKPETDAEWTRYTNLSETLRQAGHRVIGGGKVCDRMEWDRTWGVALAERAGLKVPPTHKFDDLEEAIDHVRQTKQRYVIKPHGNLGVMKNYLARDWDDLLRMMEWMRDSGHLEGSAFELQEWVDGQQLSIEGWVCRQQFYSHNSTFEFKSLLPDNHGPLTGETGSVIFYYPRGKTTKMQRDVLLTFEPMLKELQYPDGPLDINCIVNEEGAWFLEFTPRFGYPAEVIQLNSVEDDWGEAFEHIAQGTFKGFTPKSQAWFSSVLLTVPRWPYESLKGERPPAVDFQDAPMFFRVKPHHAPHVHYADVHQKDGEILVRGTDGEIGQVWAGGASIEEAEATIKRIIIEIELHNLMWRQDVGQHLRLGDLKRWGYWLPAER